MVKSKIKVLAVVNDNLTPTLLPIRESDGRSEHVSKSAQRVNSLFEGVFSLHVYNIYIKIRLFIFIAGFLFKADRC